MDAAEELEAIIDSGITFTLEPVDKLGFAVKVGNYRLEPVVFATLPSFDHAVAWLIEQVKIRYPDCEYSRRRLISDPKDFPANKVS
jgi:hypothetical protein